MKYAILFLALCWCVPAWAQDATALYDQGVAARKEGKFDEAVKSLEEASRLSPDNADVQVQLGLVLTALNRFDEARAAFERALQLAPDYMDAKLGLARLDYFDKEFAKAKASVAEILKARPDDKDARDLETQIWKAIAEQKAQEKQPITAAAVLRPKTPPPVLEETLRWRLDVNGGWSKLTGGRQDWWEGDARLSYALNEVYTLSGFIAPASRFGIEDTLLEVRVEGRPGPKYNNYLFVAVTPDADFFPKYAVGSGFGFKVRDSKGKINASVLTFDGRYADYVTGNVEALNPGVEQYFLDGRAWITAKWINVIDQDNIYSDGFLVRGDVIVKPDWRVYAGFADAPENVDANIVRTRSIFGGLVHDLNERTAWRVSVAHDDRVDLFEQIIVATGLSRRF